MTMACRDLDPRYGYVTRPESLTRLVADSPEVRCLLAAAPSRDIERENFQKGRTKEEQIQLMVEAQKHPEQYLIERLRLLIPPGDNRACSSKGSNIFVCLSSQTLVVT